MNFFNIFAAGFTSNPLWTSVDANIWQAIILIITAIIYFAIFKFNYLSIFFFVLGILAYGIFLGNSRFTGQNQTLFWVQTGIVGVICLVSFLRKRN